MIRVARFDPAKLALYGGGCVALMIASLWWWLAAGDTISGPRPFVVFGSLLAGVVAIITGYRVFRWKGPAIGIVENRVVAFGLKSPIPVEEIEDIRESIGKTDSGSWAGLVVYRKNAPVRRIHTWLLRGDRKTLCADLRDAVGLPRDPPRR
ncbi:hypothetical protein [Brevundimonas sp.]|uniref:hypothetical protein n=1 Tax=Brevundimonas sp. TaxID=1871086 RepID=UPI003563FEB8